MASQSITELVAANVRAEIGRQSLTGTELARRVGLTQPAMSRRLLGRVPFNTDELEAVALGLGVELSQLLGTDAKASA